ncbi:hypothetical protein CSIM01_02903 [Colletotrichum simmondsii]|uniref:Uncharacterized protein n=1 Tax=Colletotrichum simmondsii TaxID=703756 RepID=A0A135RSD8_9PEZI|nr:hypothetical protein CSIM01_02903 [Colletotrichum simmondsii]
MPPPPTPPPSQIPQPRYPHRRRDAYISVDEMIREAQLFIASGRARSGSLPILSKYDDLSAAQKAIPEPWMEVYMECNRMRQVAGRQALDNRIRELWDLVFTSWDTSRVVFPPAPAPKRQAAQTTMYVGTLAEDASMSAANNARAKKGHEVSEVPVWRQRGAAIFIRVNLNWEGNKLTFPFVDVKGAAFQSSIRYDLAENMTIDYAKEVLIGQWDRAELGRLGNANTSLMVHWCQNALLKDVRSVGQPGVATDDYHPDLSEMVHIELCGDV